MKAVFLLSMFGATLLQSALNAQVLPSKAELRMLRTKQTHARQNASAPDRLHREMRGSAAQGNYDALYYRLDLFVDPRAGELSGFVEMTGMAKSDEFTTVELDFYDNMTVDSVTVDAVSFDHSDNVLTLRLSRPRLTGEQFTVRIYYHGRPMNLGFSSFSFDTQSGTPIVWSLSEPYFARSWWPCKDTPNDKADSVDVVATVPNGLTVASNGLLVRRTPNNNGTTTFHWKERYPITTYLVSLAITNYATYSEWFRYGENDSMEVQYYIYPENLASARDQLDETLTMLGLFHEIFGPYPFLEEKYGIAQFPWGGGMEHQTMTSQGSFGTVLTVHELAHQWWGNKITNANWHEIWLNEGFASYAEALYFEYALGPQAYHSHMENMNWESFPYAIYVDDTTSLGRIFHGTVYDKGAWLLHMLRHVVGDSTFFDILLAYSSDPRFAYGNATSAGFQDVCESVSSMDLDWFFDAWIYQVGRPFYRVTWSVEDSVDVDFINLSIEQMQYPESGLFPMPVDITLQAEGADTVVTVFNDAPQQSFRVRAPDGVRGILVDKDNWILKRIVAVTSADEPFIPAAYVLRQNYPNPFNAGTVIEFSLSRSAQVEVVILNLRGQVIKRLVSGNLVDGVHRVTWDGQDDKGAAAASGLYLYRLRAEGYNETRKLLLIR
jgi:aminopeptidase N